MARSVHDLLKAKAMLLLKREQELYLIGVSRARTSAWLRAFNGLPIEVEPSPPAELAARWVQFLIGELKFQAAAVFKRIAATDRLELVSGRSRVAIPKTLSLAEVDELARQVHGLRDAAASSAVDELSAATGLTQFLWAYHSDHLAIAGFVPETAPFVTISKDDLAYFDVVARHLTTLLRNGALLVELKSSLAAVSAAQLQLSGKVAELEVTREQLVQSEKLAVAGHLAGAVAHEVNNPLVVVFGGLDAVSQFGRSVESLWTAAKDASHYLRTRREPEAHELALRLLVDGSESDTDELMQHVTGAVKDMVNGVHRLAALVKGFRLLAERRPSVPERVELTAIVRELGTPCPDGEIIASVDREDLRGVLRGVLAFLGARGAARATTTCGGDTDGRACIVVSAPDASASPIECRGLFDPRVRVDAHGQTMRLDLDLALAYQGLLRGGAEVSFDCARGVRVTIALPRAVG